MKMQIKSQLYTRFPERNNSTRSLRISGNRQINRLMDWMCKDATIYMSRKYNKYLDLTKTNKNKQELIIQNDSIMDNMGNVL